MSRKDLKTFESLLCEIVSGEIDFKELIDEDTLKKLMKSKLY